MREWVKKSYLVCLVSLPKVSSPVFMPLVVAISVPKCRSRDSPQENLLFPKYDSGGGDQTRPTKLLSPVEGWRCNRPPNPSAHFADRTTSVGSQTNEQYCVEIRPYSLIGATDSKQLQRTSRSAVLIASLDGIHPLRHYGHRGSRLPCHLDGSPLLLHLTPPFLPLSLNDRTSRIVHFSPQVDQP
jgi:hypothetical protein